MTGPYVLDNARDTLAILRGIEGLLVTLIKQTMEADKHHLPDNDLLPLTDALDAALHDQLEPHITAAETVIGRCIGRPEDAHERIQSRAAR